MINIFNDNKYTKWYYAIIDNAKSKNRIKLNRNSQKYIYYEIHHIIPLTFYIYYNHHHICPHHCRGSRTESRRL